MFLAEKHKGTVDHNGQVYNLGRLEAPFLVVLGGIERQ